MNNKDNPKFCRLNLGSYAFKIKYEPDSLLKLESVIFLDDTTFVTKEKDLAGNINNVQIKYGFMLMAEDFLKQTIQGKQIPTHYHLSNFIFNAKAFLDAIAITLNDFYRLEFVKGEIDLSKDKFINKLKTCNPNLADYFSNKKKWINEVVIWRDEMIHKKSIFMGYISPSNEHGDPVDLTVKMPMEPITVYDGAEEMQRLKKKYGESGQDIIKFCQNWINEGDNFIQIVYSEILNKHTKNKSSS